MTDAELMAILESQKTNWEKGMLIKAAMITSTPVKTQKPKKPHKPKTLPLDLNEHLKRDVS